MFCDFLSWEPKSYNFKGFFFVSFLCRTQVQYLPSHRGIHDLFVKRLNDYRLKFEKGESIEKDLYRLLSKWLINHIQHDDQDYVDAVRDNMLSYLRKQEEKKGKSWFSRFFS